MRFFIRESHSLFILFQSLHLHPIFSRFHVLPGEDLPNQPSFQEILPNTTFLTHHISETHFSPFFTFSPISHFPGIPQNHKNHIFTKITLFPNDSDFAQNRHFPKNPLFDLFPQNGQNGRSAQNHQKPKNAHFPKIPKIGQNPQNPKIAQNWPFLGIGSKLRFWGDRDKHTPHAPHRTDN